MASMTVTPLGHRAQGLHCLSGPAAQLPGLLPCNILLQIEHAWSQECSMQY